MAKKRVKFHERGVHDDIKYSGPLSFQSFQILGWSCIVITVVMVLIKTGMRLNPEDMKRFATFNEVISYIAELSLPFLLMANFARILNNTEGFKKQLIRIRRSTVCDDGRTMILSIIGLIMQRHPVKSEDAAAFMYVHPEISRENPSGRG